MKERVFFGWGMSNENFYRDLTVFRDFSALARFDAYSAVPGDWKVALTDVRSSTKAVREGRYKEVNLAGAASITGLLNAMPDLDLPYIFGGDGGTVLFPESREGAVRSVLADLKLFAHQTLNIDLRTGVVPLRTIRKAGYDIRVRKFEMSSFNPLAMCTGGGLDYADRLLKIENQAENQTPVGGGFRRLDLEGLSCRWEPLKSQNGAIMALIVKPLGANGAKHISRMLDNLARIAGSLDEETRPVQKNNMRYRWPPRWLWFERAAPNRNRKSALSWRLWLYLETFFQLLCERFAIKIGSYDGAYYASELRSNSDYRKYNDMLRLVLDVSPEKADRLRQHLELELEAGHLVYGMKLSDTAMMTCLLFSLEQSHHVHFIDATDGGLWSAAVDLKRRLASMDNGPSPA